MNIGEVAVIWTTLTKPPKDKIVLCVASEPMPLFIWINTDPRPHGIGQMPLSAGDHSALTHDSHLDCSRVTTFSSAEIASAGRRGAISRELAGRICEFVAGDPPRTLPPVHRDLLLVNLGGLA